MHGSRLAARVSARRLLTTPSSVSPRPLHLSIVEGPPEPYLISKTLPAYFREDILQAHHARPALIAPQEPPHPHGGPFSRPLSDARHLAWDFAEFDRHIQALARGLLGLGVKKSDRVGVIMGNNSAYACLQWACASIGAILVSLHPAYRLPELVPTLKLVGVSHLFVSPRVRSSAHVRMLCDAFPALAHSQPGAIQEAALPDLRHLIVVDNIGIPEEFNREISMAKPAIDFRQVLVWREDTEERKRVDGIMAGLDVHDIINLQFTSFWDHWITEGCIVSQLTHYNLLNNALSIGRCMHFSPSDILCNVPPLFHCMDKSPCNLAAWTYGACIVYPSEVYDPSAIVDAITQQNCTALHGVPTHFLGVLVETQRRREEGQVVDTSCLRTGVAAGSPVPIELMKQLVEKMHLNELTVAYGMTEFSPVAFQTTPDDPVVKRHETVGKILPHAKAKVVDPEGRIVPIGTPGEVLVAGYLLQKGYYNDPEQTALAMQADEEGTVWMRSGDEGIMDEEGYLRIVGRIKDIIIRGGENLFPVQIENILTAHPQIREAVAVAVPDTKYGEVVGTWIVREPHTPTISMEAVRRIVSDGMNPQNSPAWIWFVGEDGVPDEMPKTASGKIQKHILRAWSKELAQKNIGLTVSENGGERWGVRMDTPSSQRVRA